MIVIDLLTYYLLNTLLIDHECACILRGIYDCIIIQFDLAIILAWFGLILHSIAVIYPYTMFILTIYKYYNWRQAWNYELCASIWKFGYLFYTKINRALFWSFWIVVYCSRRSIRSNTDSALFDSHWKKCLYIIGGFIFSTSTIKTIINRIERNST